MCAGTSSNRTFKVPLPRLSSRSRGGIRKQPASFKGFAGRPSTSTLAFDQPRPQQDVLVKILSGEGCCTSLKEPTATGHCATRCNSQPPSSAQRSKRGEGSRPRYSYPGGGSMRKWKVLTRQSTGSSSASAGVAGAMVTSLRRTLNGPNEVPSSSSSGFKALRHTRTPVTGLASSGTSSLLAATHSMPCGIRGSSSMLSSSSSSSSGGVQ
mmetsp:Transcript_137288/g.347807  ORF Transcript_137288/g.347807 Transcript_137288/m.347807 type:complete len:210 (+) Transcript_137288:165-794(+)